RYETILSGDLAGDDGPDFTNLGDNSRVVVSSLGNDAATTLRGFTITGGWGVTGPGIRALASDVRVERCTVVRNKTLGSAGNGAGLYNSGGSPVVKDCLFRDNFAWGNGGGVWNEDGNPTFANCQFEGNTAEMSGGGLFSREATLVLESCTFNGNEAYGGAGMYALPGPGSACVDCLFSENTAREDSGGGVDLRGSGHVMTFRHCTFENNTAAEGGGLHHSSGVSNCSDLVLARCTFRGNVAGRGGALDTSYGALAATDCVFADNVAGGGGGGAVATRDGTGRRGPTPSGPGPAFVRCRFAGNRAPNSPGGGIYNDHSYTTFVNCLFVGNVARAGSGLYSEGAGPTLTHCTIAQNWGDGVLDETGQTVLEHCIVRDNTEHQIRGGVQATFCNVEGGWPGAGNIELDPCFVSAGHWSRGGDVWIDGDYHLKSQAGRWDVESQVWVQDEVTSACIDAGDPTGSIGDELFPNGGIVNLGAYGGTVEASKSYFGRPVCDIHRAGDINGDCAVDFQDLATVVSQWTGSAPPPIDEEAPVVIVAPQDGDAFVVGMETILILARVHDRAAAVTDVSFRIEGEHANGHSVTGLPGQKGANGWYLLWGSVRRRGPAQPEGTYTVTATAHYEDGTSTVSAPVTFTLENADTLARR
ncbi:MAG: right-handed parallel beta-helix repeat-containing protein, partial [Phycisphaerales bacterium]